jgi:RND family efflux transporter MFP subunit
MGSFETVRPMRLLRRLFKLLLPVAVIALGLGGFVYLAQTRATPQPAEPAPQIWPVEAITVALEDRQPLLELYGEIVAGRRADIRASVAGEVARVAERFRDGALVRQGETLLEIDPFDYRATLDERRAELAEAQARLAELRARKALEEAALARERDILELAERETERRERLAQRGAVSTQALDDSREELLRTRQSVTVRENTVAAEEARIAQQQAAIERLRVRVRMAERDLARTTIAAPFTGLLGETAVELGQRVGVNEAVAELVDATRLEARFQLSETQYGRLLACRDGLVGRAATVAWRVGVTAIEFPATVERVDASIRMDTGGVAVFARLDGLTPDTALRPGAFVEVRLPDCGYEDVASLPAAALHGEDRVFVIDEQGRLAERRVEPAAVVGETVLVRSGLAEGDRVVTSRFTEARAGDAVEVR